MKLPLVLVLMLLTFFAALEVSAQWGKPVAPVIPEADGYVSIPNAAVPPDRKRTYRAIYDATRFPKEPSQLLPALNMAGSELNAFGAGGVPPRNRDRTRTVRQIVRTPRDDEPGALVERPSS